MIYDIDDWERPGHQTRALFQPFQIDTSDDYECRVTPYWNSDIQFDFQYWEDIKNGQIKNKQFRFRTDQLREARRTVSTFEKRRFVDCNNNKNYPIEFAKYNRAKQLLKEYEDEVP